MKVIKPSVRMETNIKNDGEVYQLLERIGRVSHQSENRIAENSAPEFIERIIFGKGHYGLLEHYSVTLRLICNRGISHELVRHRIASFVEESTRYVGHKELTVIDPCFLEKESTEYQAWYITLEHIESIYTRLVRDGMRPEYARDLLPNALKTEVMVTMNLRGWWHFILTRYCGYHGKVHPQMKEIAGLCWDVLKKELPWIFGREALENFY